MKFTNPDQRPIPLKPCFGNVPSEMRHVKQWVMWKYVWKDADRVWSKVPFKTNGIHAKSNDASTWGSFESCFLTYEQNQSQFDGIGFVFSDDSDFVGIDLDNCVSRVGDKRELTPFALRVMEKLATYTEISPSGTGIHLIGKSKAIVPLKTKFNGNEIEVYRTGRYFTFTGLAVTNPILDARDIHTELTEICDKIRPKQISKESATPVNQAETLNLTIESRLRMALKNEKTKRWFEGDISEHGFDDSRADMALLRNLAFFCDGNRDILDAMFRQSKLMRPKWDDLRGTDTYGNNTMGKILSTQTEYASFINKHEKNKSDYNSRNIRRVKVNDIWDATMAYRESGDARGVEVGWSNLTELYRPAKGQFSVVTGLPGSGKSTFVDCLCFNIAKLHDWKITFASFETLPMQRHILNFAQIATQKPTFKFIDNHATDSEMEEIREFLNEHFYFIKPADDELTIEQLFEYVSDDIKEHQIDGFVLDPYTELDEKRGYGMSETEHIKQILKYGQRFTRNNQIHWWLIAHPVKSGETYIDGRPSLRSIAGSQNFYNKMDFGLVVHRVENQTKVFVDKVRFDINGKMGECEFDFDSHAKTYTPVGEQFIQEMDTETRNIKEWSF